MVSCIGSYALAGTKATGQKSCVEIDAHRNGAVVLLV